nr:CDP-glycerol glycerophosphotransferase family protein [Tetragenococcus halophilus]
MKPIYYSNKDVWLGFEKFSSTAQDNGYAFFQYVEKNKLHDDFYFILDKNSSDYEEVKRESSNVVPFMSFKYFLLVYASRLLVSSENKRHVYNLRIRTGLVPRKITRKQSVFLQHGVTALKQSNVFKKAKGRGNFNLVIATSDLEKEIIHENWKYELNEIAVTGFSRWDKLFDKSKNRERRKIFVMPTWRTWMEDMPKEDFKRTDYYDNYINFLNSNELEIILEKYNLQLVFFLHPKFKQYISEFYLNSDHISLKGFQSIKVNEEIMEASLMISDYSSVTWDMFFMKKPVLFYQFDYEKYEEYEGSYIDMETQLFGERALNKEELIQLIEEYAENNFQLKPYFENLHEEYYKYADHNNSKRIFDAIQGLN